MTSYDSETSGSCSASREKKEMDGGFCRGYEEARVRRMRDIWAQGAAQGVWKEMQMRELAGREEMVEWNWESVVISVTSDMLIVGEVMRGSEGCGKRVVSSV